MSGVLHKLKHFNKSLTHFSFPLVENDIHRIHDQFALITLKGALKDVIKESEDDYDISHFELAQIQSNCKNCFDENLNSIVQEINSYCESVLSERTTLLKKLLDFIYDCKMLSSPAFIDLTKVDPGVVAVGKKLYKTKDMVAYIHTQEFETLIESIYKFHFFSQQHFLEISIECQQFLEQKLSKLRLANKRVNPKHSSLQMFAPSFAQKMQALTSTGLIVTGSAPTSPTQTATEKAPRSYSAPNSAKAKIATERTLLVSSERGRASSDAMRATGSTSSTALLTDQNAFADDFFHLTIGPSSKSEDESDERKMQERKEKDKTAHKKHHHRKQ